MKILLIYDSVYGNTTQIADSIASVLPEGTEKKIVSKASLSDMEGKDFLIVGSPTQGGKPSLAMTNFLEQIPHKRLKNVLVAAFDTRFAAKEHGLGLRLLMNVIGFAAEKIEHVLVSKGAKPLLNAEGFIVESKEGPLKSGEVQRAGQWALKVTAAANALTLARQT